MDSAAATSTSCAYAWETYMEQRRPQRSHNVFYEIFTNCTVCSGDQVLDILNSRPPGSPIKIPDSKTDQLYTNGTYTCSATSDETEIFSAFQTTSNICYLHSDLSLMPSRRETWSSWNYLINTHPMPGQPAGVSLTYNMNILQHILTDKYGDVLVTMNPDHRPRWDLLQVRFS
jgi:hypothetical protein